MLAVIRAFIPQPIASIFSCMHSHLLILPFVSHTQFFSVSLLPWFNTNSFQRCMFASTKKQRKLWMLSSNGSKAITKLIALQTSFFNMKNTGTILARVQSVDCAVSSKCFCDHFGSTIVTFDSLQVQCTICPIRPGLITWTQDSWLTFVKQALDISHFAQWWQRSLLRRATNAVVIKTERLHKTTAACFDRHKRPRRRFVLDSTTRAIITDWSHRKWITGPQLESQFFAWKPCSSHGSED